MKFQLDTAKLRGLVFGAALTLAAAPLLAQTVGEILDKGAQKLDAAALRAAISGATMRGRTAAGFDFTTQMNPDGTLRVRPRAAPNRTRARATGA